MLATIEPFLLVILYPINIAVLIAIAPGIDSATANKSIMSLEVTHFFFPTISLYLLS